MIINKYALCIIYNYHRDFCRFIQQYHGHGYQARVWLQDQWAAGPMSCRINGV